MKRLALALTILAAVAGIRSLLGGPAAAPDPWRSVPESIKEAAEAGRYWRAARLLDRHLEGARDTAPSTILLAARLDAGWSHWAGVRQALDGRPWLDTVGRAEGWELLGRARVAGGDPEAGAAALAAYLEVGDPADDVRATVELRRGIALGRAGRAEEALSAFDRAASLAPWFQDWIDYLAAEAAAGAGLTAEVDRRLASAVGPAPWRLRVTAALTAGDTAAARDAARAAAGRGERAARSEAWAELGRLRLAAGDTARARDAFGRAMAVRGSVGAVDAARRLSELDPTPAEWRTIAGVYQWHGNAARAADGYAAYLAAGTGTPADRARARLELGRARYNAGRFRQAAAGLLALAGDSVADRIGAEALYLAARSQYRSGRVEAGQATFLRLAERYPGQEAVTRGLYLLADLRHDDLELDGPVGARTLYRRAAEASPARSWAGLALMRLAGLAFLEEDYQRAVGIWEEYRTLHPDGRRIGQATYWAARSYRRMGQDSLALARLRDVRRVDPISFYGVRAAELLGRPVLEPDLPAGPPMDGRSDSLVRAGLRRVDLLAALDRREDLVHEVERLRRRFQAAEATGEAGEYALAEALNERGYTLTGIGMGWDLYERHRAWNRRLLQVVYPFPFRHLVVPEALDRGLDPYLVAGLIRRESAFNPVVVSGAGAIGLMQIVPATGRSLARAAGLRAFDAELLTRPEVNIHLGTRFFAELEDRFDAPLTLVLAAYNAGPTRASEWRELPEITDPELFAERVPYGETRDYIRNVLLHRALYRALYPGLTETASGADATGAAPIPGPR